MEQLELLKFYSDRTIIIKFAEKGRGGEAVVVLSSEN